MTILFFKIILVLAVFGLTMLIAMYSTWAERKLSAVMQDRVGPNRAGPMGLLQPLADGIKMFTKEELIPEGSNRFLFIIGPGIAMLTALITGAVIPWGGDVSIGGESFALQITDINIGVLYLFGVVSIGVYGIMIGGWASNNKYSLLGALRASSQMISYEIAMGLSMISLIMMTGTLSLREIVAQQDAGVANVLYQPLAFLIFMICAFAETNRAPFDLPECETELIFAGRHPQDFLALVPESHLAAAFVAIAVGIHGLGVPDPAFEAESPVGQCTHWADINHVAGKIVVNRLFDVRGNLCMVAPTDDAVNPAVRDLLANLHAAVAEDAAVHVQLHLFTNVNRLESAAAELAAGVQLAVLVAEVLQVALARLVAHGAVERVVDEQELGHACPCLHHFRRGFVANHHAVHYRGAAAWHQLGHGPWVFGRALLHLHEAGTAVAAAALQRGIVAHGRRHEVAANHAGRIENRRAFGHFDLEIVYGD